MSELPPRPAPARRKPARSTRGRAGLEVLHGDEELDVTRGGIRGQVQVEPFDGSRAFTLHHALERHASGVVGAAAEQSAQQAGDRSRRLHARRGDRHAVARLPIAGREAVHLEHERQPALCRLAPSSDDPGNGAASGDAVIQPR